MILINKVLLAVYSKIRILFFVLQGAKIGRYVAIMPGVTIARHISKVTIGNYTALDRYVQIIISVTKNVYSSKPVVNIGNHVYINRFTILDASELISIGNGTMIGPHCYITDHDHSFKNLSADTPIGELPLTGRPTFIEENVWIGSNVVILKGVTIGRNSIIGAGSIVTKNIAPNSVAVGNPCKVIRKR